MNQNWGLDNLLFFNNEGGNWELYTYKVVLDYYFDKNLGIKFTNIVLQTLFRQPLTDI